MIRTINEAADTCFRFDIDTIGYDGSLFIPELRAIVIENDNINAHWNLAYEIGADFIICLPKGGDRLAQLLNDIA